MLFKSLQRFSIEFLLMMSLWASFGVPVVLGQDSMFVSFEMEDQFEVTYSSELPLKQPTVVIISDRGGSSAAVEWGKAITRANGGYAEGDLVEILAIADVGSVPSILRPFVRRLIRRERPHPILLDWAGQFADAFPLQSGQANILVFAPDGSLRVHVAGNEVRPSDLNYINSQISILVESGTK